MQVEQIIGFLKEATKDIVDVTGEKLLAWFHIAAEKCVAQGVSYGVMYAVVAVILLYLAYVAGKAVVKLAQSENGNKFESLIIPGIATAALVISGLLSASKIPPHITNVWAHESCAIDGVREQAVRFKQLAD